MEFGTTIAFFVAVGLTTVVFIFGRQLYQLARMTRKLNARIDESTLKALGI
jgi:hypothetical protein